MQAKIIEVRDRMTFIPMLCVDMNPAPFHLTSDAPTNKEIASSYEAQRYLLRRCGYPCDGSPVILMTALRGEDRATSDPHYWTDRTRATAHAYITEHWQALKDGDVVDVEFILGETELPKRSEREDHPL